MSTREHYPELTTEQYLNLKIGDSIKYLYYVLGNYIERGDGKIAKLIIKGSSVDDGFYEYKYDNQVILSDGAKVTYCDITEVIE